MNHRQLIINQIRSQMEHACECVNEYQHDMAKAAFLECANLAELLKSEPKQEPPAKQLTIDIP